MTLSITKVNRPRFYDSQRNLNTGLGVLQYVASGVAPAANTVRATYTVPANKLALLSSMSAHIARATVAGTAGRVSAYIRMNSSDTQPVAQARFYTNTVGDKDSLTAMGLAGPITTNLQISTEDLSTTGTVDFRVGVGIVEIDA